MTRESEQAFINKKCKQLKKFLPQTEDEFQDEVDELTWKWGRHLLPYVDKRRDDIASYKRRTIMKQKPFFQKLRLFKPLALKYPTLLKRLNIMQYPDLENKDFELNGHWIKNEEKIAGFSYADYLAYTQGQMEKWDAPKLGDLIQGKVAALTPEGAFIEIGTKSWAYMPLKNISLAPLAKASEVLQVDQEIMANVESLDSPSIVPGDKDANQIVLTMIDLQTAYGWDELERILSAEEGTDPILQVEVKSMKSWGAVVQTERGFEGIIPNAHLADKVGDTSIVGGKLSVEILNTDRNLKISGAVAPRDFALTFSHKNAATKELSQKVEEGQVITAKVKEVTIMQLNVEVDGTVVSIRKVDISRSVNFNMFDVFEADEEIKVYVISTEEKSGQIRLSTRALESKGGEILTDKAGVFERAEETAKSYFDKSSVQKDKAISTLEATLGEIIPSDSDDALSPSAPTKEPGVIDLDDEDDDASF